MKSIPQVIQLPFDGSRLCACGCGRPTTLASITRSKDGITKGQPLRYLHGHSGRRKFDAEKRATEFWARVQKGAPDECWLFDGKPGRRYRRINWGGRRNLSMSVHRLAYMLTYGSITEGMLICHRCDNPRCCNPAHLFEGTGADNMLDKVSKGRQTRGETVGTSKLTWAIVRALNERFALGGITKAELAREFGITKVTCGRVLNGVTWKE
jgi:hypothetical protein